MIKIYGSILLLFIFSLSCSSDRVVTNDNQEIGPINVILGISFPPVANEEQRIFTKPLLDELNVKQIRIGENWSLREPSEGNFNWSPLDDRMNWAFNNDIDILLTIQSNGPDWACSSEENSNSCVYIDNTKFKNYIEQLLQRYPNKISKIQYGNEWQSDFWYVGSGQQFTFANDIVYNAIQEYSPSTKLVLGGFTTISLRFLAGCNGLIDSFYDDEGNLYDQEFLQTNCNSSEIQDVIEKINFVLDNASYDMIDLHLYDDVENWSIYYNHVKNMVQKPIIITEFGGPNVNLESDSQQYQANRLGEYIETINELGVIEAYFFKLVEGSNNPAHAKSGLIDASNLSKKESFFVFKEYNK